MENLDSSLVTWHVAIWALFAVAINSMAQPAGKICGIRSRHRIYLASSPIICAADAVLMAIRLACTAIYIPVSPQKAARLVILWRTDSHTMQVPPAPVRVPEKPEPQLQTWPRWLFFVIGVLPMVIKLASFSGVPWTKTWGLMFAVSFAVIELLTFFAQAGIYEHATSVPAVLSISSDEWDSPERDDLRSKLADLSTIHEGLDLFTFSIAFSIQICLTLWATARILSPTKGLPENVHNLLSWISTGMASFVALVLVICLALKAVGYFIWGAPISRNLERLGISKTQLFVAVMTMLPPTTKHEGRFAELIRYLSIAYNFSVLTWLCYKGLDGISGRWPAVARALLVEKPSSKPLEGSSEESDVEQNEGAISGMAVMSLFFFIINFVVCSLWYAAIYDPAGTTNPPWTDVFG